MLHKASRKMERRMMPEKWSVDGTARGGPIERAERARFELLMGRHLKTYPFILTSAAY
jgi:hypothetical protein